MDGRENYAPRAARLKGGGTNGGKAWRAARGAGRLTPLATLSRHSSPSGCGRPPSGRSVAGMTRNPTTMLALHVDRGRRPDRRRRRAPGALPARSGGTVHARTGRALVGWVLATALGAVIAAVHADRTMTEDT